MRSPYMSVKKLKIEWNFASDEFVDVEKLFNK
jgi:hypothetical protein